MIRIGKLQVHQQYRAWLDKWITFCCRPYFGLSRDWMAKRVFPRMSGYCWKKPPTSIPYTAPMSTWSYSYWWSSGGPIRQSSAWACCCPWRKNRILRRLLCDRDNQKPSYWLADCIWGDIPVVIEESFVYFQNRVYYLPWILGKAVALYVGREVPWAKTTANASEFIDEFLFPREWCVRGRGIV